MRIHNETVNIWLHLIGFILFLILFQYDILITLPKFGSGMDSINYFLPKRGPTGLKKVKTRSIQIKIILFT